MKTKLHKAVIPEIDKHGWLNRHQTFSFAHYYHPSRMHFSTLRVLNAYIIDGESGFGKLHTT
jgi:redox-sensitive bicupin YhaK (pirin superfamily)